MIKDIQIHCLVEAETAKFPPMQVEMLHFSSICFWLPGSLRSQHRGGIIGFDARRAAACAASRLKTKPIILIRYLPIFTSSLRKPTKSTIKSYYDASDSQSDLELMSVDVLQMCRFSKISEMVGAPRNLQDRFEVMKRVATWPRIRAAHVHMLLVG